ncbi:hypothetical protein BD413DRAFT_154993 [Trametes elegans]|nr:hypothetical protein BD413DRAFT_154993 [Trametes elegans]
MQYLQNSMLCRPLLALHGHHVSEYCAIHHHSRHHNRPLYAGAIVANLGQSAFVTVDRWFRRICPIERSRAPFLATAFSVGRR